MHNFNGYFSKDNPKYLTDKFSRESRIARRKLKFKVGLESAVCQKRPAATQCLVGPRTPDHNFRDYPKVLIA